MRGIRNLLTGFEYIKNVRGVHLRDELDLWEAILHRVVNVGRGAYLEQFLKRPLFVRSWDGFIFAVRPNTPDLYIVAVSERYEIDNWFRPLAKGIVVDVGAFIGTYTVRACNQADLVIAIEPIKTTFKLLEVNTKLNCNRNNVILINKAVSYKKGLAMMKIPLNGLYVHATRASLSKYSSNVAMKYTETYVETDTLDDILQTFGIDRIDFLKVDVEGAVSDIFIGMVGTLKKLDILWLN